MMRKEFLLVEKYRPQTLDDCILPESLRKTFQEFLVKGEIPNLMFSGSAGIGKTTIAKILCKTLNCDWIMINGSMHGNIDTLRTKIQSFASSVSLTGGKKVIILDEADHLNPQSTQPALRGFIEEFSANCRFIFTCNYKNKIIPELHSRCSCIDFILKKEEKAQIAESFHTRLRVIFDEEGIDCSPKVSQGLVLKHFPDFRRILNEVQRHSASGTIDESILLNFDEIDLKQLIVALKAKNFGDMRKWVTQNMDNDFEIIMRRIYDSLYTNMENHSIPQAILILHEYLYRGAFVVDQEINLVACLTEVMSKCDFK